MEVAGVVRFGVDEYFTVACDVSEQDEHVHQHQGVQRLYMAARCSSLSWMSWT